jgi:hypothetical protein
MVGVRAQALFSGDAGRLVLDKLLLERLKVWRGSRVLRVAQRFSTRRSQTTTGALTIFLKTGWIAPPR